MLNYILLQAFQNFSRHIISELIINLKYSFNIPFRINLKTIIMGTSSQLYDGAQLKFYPHLTQRYYFWSEFKKPLSRPGAPFKTITKTLIYNSTNFLILTLSQYGTLSFWSICYTSCLLAPGINTPLFRAVTLHVAEPSLYLNITMV